MELKNNTFNFQGYSEEYANLEKEERILRKEIQMANLMNSKKIGGTKGGERRTAGRGAEGEKIWGKWTKLLGYWEKFLPI